MLRAISASDYFKEPPWRDQSNIETDNAASIPDYFLGSSRTRTVNTPLSRAESSILSSSAIQKPITASKMNRKPDPAFPFLDLPLEVRLQIYSYLLPLHQAQHAHLSPSSTCPPPIAPTSFHEAVLTFVGLPDLSMSGKSWPDQSSRNIVRPASGKKTHVSRRSGQGCGFIPSTMLRACRQINYEARSVPWSTNEFIFINWFCSGVYAARSFLQSLKPWQREQMRYARVEVLARDLRENQSANSIVSGEAGKGEWVDLCRLWSGGDEGEGLRGLRLGIKGRVEDTNPSRATDFWRDVDSTGFGMEFTAEMESDGVVWQAQNEKIAAHSENVLDVKADWVVFGIKAMRSLKWIDIEIEDDEVSRDQKLQFCNDLGNELSSYGRDIQVTYIERATDAEESKPPQTPTNANTVEGLEVGLAVMEP